MIISMIAAMANNRIIGQNNQMPWHLPADLQHFKKVTLGKPVIMGRKTFESIGRPLPGRKNIVISRNESFTAEGVFFAKTPEQAIEIAGEVDEVMIIGGGHVYELFLPKCHRLYLTFIALETMGDTQFPDYEKVGPWQLVSSEKHQSDKFNPYGYTFVTYTK